MVDNAHAFWCIMLQRRNKSRKRKASVGEGHGVDARTHSRHQNRCSRFKRIPAEGWWVYLRTSDRIIPTNMITQTVSYIYRYKRVSLVVYYYYTKNTDYMGLDNRQFVLSYFEKKVNWCVDTWPVQFVTHVGSSSSRSGVPQLGRHPRCMQLFTW